MAKRSTDANISIQLYDADIDDLLNAWGPDIALPRATPDHLGVFENLQEQALIYAISQFNYPRAYSLLRKLDHTLSPTDAMAACLCALACTPKLMNTLLDHCPPIPEFQFQGVGLASSLLNVAVRHDKDEMLDILLNRGADPNGGPTPLTTKSPVEEAFCHSAYCSLQRLLEVPDLEIALTEEMLNTWASLTDDSAIAFHPFQNPCQLWCCQHLLEKLTGEPPSLFDPLPVPPQLRLGHALRRNNFQLAAHICETRSLTDADKADVLAHYDLEKIEFCLLEEDNGFYYTARQQEIRFLTCLLAQYPDLLHQLRSAIAAAALALPEPDEKLQCWVRQMEAGPVMIPALPREFGVDQRSFQAFPWWTESSILEESFFLRWTERLGQELVPAMDHDAADLHGLTSSGVRQVLERIQFIGETSPDMLSSVARQAMYYAPEDMLPSLLQPGGLLAREYPAALLDACQDLPLSRRRLILPLLSKAVDYTL